MKPSEKIADKFFDGNHFMTPKDLAAHLAESGVDRAFDVVECMWGAARRVPVRFGVMGKTDMMAADARKMLAEI